MRLSGKTSGRQLAVLFLARIALNTAYRIVYPFLPAIARGLDISVASASRLVSLRLLPGLAAPWLGGQGDRQGRRRMIEPALLVFSAAGLLIATVGKTWAVAAALVLYGLSKVLFDPSLHAFLGDAVPYSERARAIGIIELSWSSAWLLGVPVSGYLIQRFGWRSPWALLGALGLASLLLLHRVLPREPRSPGANESRGRRLASRSWLAVLRRPGVLPMLVTGTLMTFAVELPFIVYGAWLEEAFGLSLTSLGLASVAIGVAEATSELGTTFLTDRFGKRRSILAGLLGLAGGLALLPRLAGLGLVAAMSGIVLVVLAFEFAIVSFIPLATEISPDARASFLSYNMTAALVGRLLGSLTGGWLWERQVGGIALQAYVGAAASLVAFLVMLVGVQEIRDATKS